MIRHYITVSLYLISGTIGAVSDGMHYGWTSPVLPILERNDTHIELSHEDHIWLESVYLIGGICGLPVTILAVDRIGRKESILLSAVAALVSWILIAVADNVLYLYIARFIVGLSGDVAFVAAPMYIAEIADKKIRGFLSAIIYVMMLIGILVIYAVAPYVPFYVPSIIGSILVIIQLVTFPFVPDSPYYLISKGKNEKAKRHLQRLRAAENIDDELAEITAAVNRQKQEKGRPQDLVLCRGNRKALLIMLILNGAQHFSSISVMLMNLHPILTAADSIYLSSNVAGILFSALMLLAATIADFVVDKFGRKSLLIISSTLSGVCLLLLAIYFTLQKNDYDVKPFSWLPVAVVMIYAFVFKFGLGIIPIVMTAELFPAKVKAMGMTVADFFYVFFAWVSIELYQRLVIYAGYDYPFYIFAVCCLCTSGFAQVYIPETKGKTLEEIQFLLKGIPFPMRSNSLKSDTLPYTFNSIENDLNVSETDIRKRQQTTKGKNANDKV